MKQLFGEYLVKKQLITQEQLIDALVEQTSETPSVLEICYKQNIFNPEQILSILHCQSELDLEFTVAGKKLNLWDESKNDSVNKYISAERTPLGQILVTKGHLNNEQLLDILDDYLNDSDAELTTSSVDQTTTAEPEPTETTATISNEPEASSPPDATFYYTYFNKKFLEELLQQTTAGAESLDNLLFQVHSLRGLSQFVGLTLSHNLLKKIEDLILKMKQAYTKEQKDDASEALCLEIFSCLWDIRENLEKGVSENEYAKQPEHQVQLQKF